MNHHSVGKQWSSPMFGFHCQRQNGTEYCFQLEIQNATITDQSLSIQSYPRADILTDQLDLNEVVSSSILQQDSIILSCLELESDVSRSGSLKRWQTDGSISFAESHNIVKQIWKGRFH